MYKSANFKTYTLRIHPSLPLLVKRNIEMLLFQFYGSSLIFSAPPFSFWRPFILLGALFFLLAPLYSPRRPLIFFNALSGGLGCLCLRPVLHQIYCWRSRFIYSFPSSSIIQYIHTSYMRTLN